jgi:hypothetical protein
LVFGKYTFLGRSTCRLTHFIFVQNVYSLILNLKSNHSILESSPFEHDFILEKDVGESRNQTNEYSLAEDSLNLIFSTCSNCSTCTYKDHSCA